MVCRRTKVEFYIKKNGICQTKQVDLKTGNLVQDPLNAEVINSEVDRLDFNSLKVSLQGIKQAIYSMSSQLEDKTYKSALVSHPPGLEKPLIDKTDQSVDTKPSRGVDELVDEILKRKLTQDIGRGCRQPR